MPNNQGVSNEIPLNLISIETSSYDFCHRRLYEQINILTRAAVNLSNVSHIEISSLRFGQTLGYTVLYKNKAL